MSASVSGSGAIPINVLSPSKRRSTERPSRCQVSMSPSRLSHWFVWAVNSIYASKNSPASMSVSHTNTAASALPPESSLNSRKRSPPQPLAARMDWGRGNPVSR